MLFLVLLSSTQITQIIIISAGLATCTFTCKFYMKSLTLTVELWVPCYNYWGAGKQLLIIAVCVDSVFRIAPRGLLSSLRICPQLFSHSYAMFNSARAQQASTSFGRHSWNRTLGLMHVVVVTERIRSVHREHDALLTRFWARPPPPILPPAHVVWKSVVA